MHQPHTRMLRAGVVYSATSSSFASGEFDYERLFMCAQQQALMAGVPFDLLNEIDLTDTDRLALYSALVLPSFQFVDNRLVASIGASVESACEQYGTGLVTAGDFLTTDQEARALDGESNYWMMRLLGLKRTGEVSISGARVDTIDSNHPVLRNFKRNPALLAQDAHGMPIYEPLNENSSAVIAAFRSDDWSAPAIIATEMQGRNVHFSTPELLCAGNLMSRALQWAIHGNSDPIALKASRHQSVVSIRFDMDMSKYANDNHRVCSALNQKLKEWKLRYNLVSSCYINIGCDESKGERTDWAVSGPIYKQYLILGNEIGTHSYSHPFNTRELTDGQLDFEFQESKRVIEQQLDIAIRGGAVPGRAESLRVSQRVDSYLDHLSGRYSGIDGHYAGAIGFPYPSCRLVYFCYHLDADYTLIEWYKKSAAETESRWISDYEQLTLNGLQPVIHVLWHDYGPTIGERAGYRVQMYENLARHAHQHNAEFVTVGDIEQRLRSFMKADFSIRRLANDMINISVQGASLGQLSILTQGDKIIQSADGWYAYDEKHLFLPRQGGDFTITLGVTQAPRTRIHSLPMRAELLSVDGDGANLSFVFTGEGSLVVMLASEDDYELFSESVVEVSRNGRQLSLHFPRHGIHGARITRKGRVRCDGDAGTEPGIHQHISAS